MNQELNTQPIIDENLSADSVNSHLDDAVESFDPKKMSVKPKDEQVSAEQEGRSNHWEVRTQEQSYAFLKDNKTEVENRYGQLIDLVELSNEPKNRSMFINENPEVGSNPNRNKQHGFFFTADNCIGCHACEAACSEKNENPAHIAFRSVGYVEGGSYPDYKRMNISMACNHCDDPVCLKGCPTKAYTKHAEYGAVLQDPETCFGCGYCTWVCPYNAPQLDPVKGRVSKCNMCVDRLEVGLKPACVSACVGNALDFGVIENTPENREQCKTSIPGFPDPEITHPNIRFQQTKTLPIEMNRTDSMPVKYHKNQEGEYKPVIDQKAGKAKHWNLAKLNSRENPLVLFTLLAQAGVGTFAIALLGALAGVDVLQRFITTDMVLVLTLSSLGLTAFALLMSVTHLGKPMRFYRGFNNLRYSPMAREGFGLAMFSLGAGITSLLLMPNNQWLSTYLLHTTSIDISYLASDLSDVYANGFTNSFAITAASVFTFIAGAAGLYYMNKCYQIKARPFWNHSQTATAFLGSSISLGAVVSGVLVLATLFMMNIEANVITDGLGFFGAIFIGGILVEALGLIRHHLDLSKSDNEGGAAHYIQLTTFGKTYRLRNALLTFNILLVSLLLISTQMSVHTGAGLGLGLWLGWSLAIAIYIATSLIGRALFYILVIPTTMPGAFFWKNKGFEQHARDIGLAENPASGIAPACH